MTDDQHWAPARIWLQRGVGEGGSHTWCEDQIGDEVEEAAYVRVGAVPVGDAEAERKKFEDWAVGWRDEHNVPLFIMKRDNGKYMDRATEKAWWGWSARAGILPF